MELKVENKIPALEAEKLTENANKITDEKIEKSLNYDELSEADGSWLVAGTVAVGRGVVVLALHQDAVS